MIVTAWNNGKNAKSGAGYGLKIDKQDRDANFIKDWNTIELDIPGDPVPTIINIKKDSFWGLTCREIINKKIGIWLLSNKFAPWPKDNPPKFFLIKISGNKFRIGKQV